MPRKPPSPTHHSSGESPTEHAISTASSTSLASLRTSTAYLLSPSTAASPKSLRLRTRFLLRSLHYLGQFLLWRLVRWAKYIAIGALGTAVAGSVVGSLVTPVGWVIAPTGVVGGLVAAGVWGVGRFAVRRVGARIGVRSSTAANAGAGTTAGSGSGERVIARGRGREMVREEPW